MNILIVGNVLKDVYLNLDTRTEKFETDQHGHSWLDLNFNASEHHFFNRTASLSGAAVTLETLTNLGLKAVISDSTLSIKDGTIITNDHINTYRYILLSDDGVSYFTPTDQTVTIFDTPDDFYDYIYVDRSAKLDQVATDKIISYLNFSRNTKLILYIRNFDNQSLNRLIDYADLIFLEPSPITPQLNPKKIIRISNDHFSYLDITEPFFMDRIDTFTHLSSYSIAAATILGSFILGHSVEDSLKLARANVENSRINTTLPIDKLQKIVANFTSHTDLELTTANLMLPPKGILAADESGGSIHKKFEQLNIPDTYETRRDYRNIFFTTPNLEKYVNGVILFDETARQFADNGQTFVDYLTSRRIIPGIKVDQGLATFGEFNETYTKGLDDLPSRLSEYYNLGLRFAKWRAAFELRLDENGNILTPTDQAITKNCQILAEYAKACQTANLVPIVEPELVYDGYYSIEQNATVTAKILDTLFQELSDSDINLRACILKVNMVLAGKQFETPSTPEEIGQETATVLKEHVPTDLAGIVFLSGGQTPEQATENLAAIASEGPFTWPITFSFARALQDPALYAWHGDNANADKASQAFLERLIANVNAIETAQTKTSPTEIK